jgi:hypothetical protein
MESILRLALGVAIGVLFAAGLAWLVGVVFPQARLAVFVIAAAWWAWTIWRYTRPPS